MSRQWHLTACRPMPSSRPPPTSHLTPSYRFLPWAPWCPAPASSLSSRTLGNLTGSLIPRALSLPWFPCYLIPPSSLVLPPRTRAWMVGQAGLSLLCVSSARACWVNTSTLHRTWIRNLSFPSLPPSVFIRPVLLFAYRDGRG